jgi:hypothetical protein
VTVRLCGAAAACGGRQRCDRWERVVKGAAGGGSEGDGLRAAGAAGRRRESEAGKTGGAAGQIEAGEQNRKTFI